MLGPCSRRFAHILCSPVKISVLVNLSGVSILFQSERLDSQLCSRLDSQLCSRILCRSVVNACIPVLAGKLLSLYVIIMRWNNWPACAAYRPGMVFSDKHWPRLHNTWLMVSLRDSWTKGMKAGRCSLNTRNCLQGIQECWVTALGWSTVLWALSPVHFDLNICSTVTASR